MVGSKYLIDTLRDFLLQPPSTFGFLQSQEEHLCMAVLTPDGYEVHGLRDPFPPHLRFAAKNKIYSGTAIGPNNFEWTQLGEGDGDNEMALASLFQIYDPRMYVSATEKGVARILHLAVDGPGQNIILRLDLEGLLTKVLGIREESAQSVAAMYGNETFDVLFWRDRDRNKDGRELKLRIDDSPPLGYPVTARYD